MKFGAPGAALARPAMVNNMLLTTRIIDLRVFIFISFVDCCFLQGRLQRHLSLKQTINNAGHGTFTQKSQFAHGPLFLQAAMTPGDHSHAAFS
jgi:hypothetical protein